MKLRGDIYWNWANPALHVRSHDERLADGTLIDVQVRTSTLGKTQLFLGAYGPKGVMLFEEAFDSRPGETMTMALEWGLNRARQKSPAGSMILKGVKPGPLPRTGSRIKK